MPGKNTHHDLSTYCALITPCTYHSLYLPNLVMGLICASTSHDLPEKRVSCSSTTATVFNNQAKHPNSSISSRDRTRGVSKCPLSGAVVGRIAQQCQTLLPGSWFFFLNARGQVDVIACPPLRAFLSFRCYLLAVVCLCVIGSIQRDSERGTQHCASNVHLSLGFLHFRDS